MNNSTGGPESKQKREIKPRLWICFVWKWHQLCSENLETIWKFDGTITISSGGQLIGRRRFGMQKINKIHAERMDETIACYNKIKKKKCHNKSTCEEFPLFRTRSQFGWSQSTAHVIHTCTIQWYRRTFNKWAAFMNDSWRECTEHTCVVKNQPENSMENPHYLTLKCFIFYQLLMRFSRKFCFHQRCNQRNRRNQTNA